MSNGANSTLVAAALRGSARALDGDTIDLSTQTGVLRIRLEGIDAPEGGQRCNLKWLSTWDCGKAATLALTDLIAGHEVICDDRGLDRYGRTLGVCFANGRDINAEMVRAGLAWAFVRYSPLYVEHEAIARSLKAGVWQAATQPPWDWRAQQKQAKPAVQPPTTFATMGPRAATPAAPDAGPAGCTIKGNVTPNGRIYHTTESPWYDKVRMNLGIGRRWFCSEAEARDAGWRPAVTERSR
jgi:endonuclease YncB( thermonuclease family)